MSGYSLPDTAERNKPGGQYKGVSLTRSAPPPPPPPPPPPSEVIIDDLNPGFVRGGPQNTCANPNTNGLIAWCYATTCNNIGCPYAGHYWYSWNQASGADENFGKWVPNLPCAAVWRVYAYVPPDHAYTTQARYQVVHAGGVTQVYVNQQASYGWIDLGVHNFNAGTGGYLYLGDTTGETNITKQIGMDAARWVRESPCPVPETPTPTPSPSPTPTPTPTPSPTPTPTQSATPTPTPTPSQSAAPTPTASPTLTPTPSPTVQLVSVTPTASPGPTDSATSPPSPTPTPSAAPAEAIWGDSDCDGQISSRDNQALLRKVLGQPPLFQAEQCPDMGAEVPASRTWGDWDCDGDVSSRDNQALLRAVLGQSALSQSEPCPDLGTSDLSVLRVD